MKKDFCSPVHIKNESKWKHNMYIHALDAPLDGIE